MTLQRWWKKYKANGGTLKTFHRESGILPSHMSEYLSGRKSPGLRITNKLIQETSGLVGYKELMPDLYEKIMGGHK